MVAIYKCTVQADETTRSLTHMRRLGESALYFWSFVLPSQPVPNRYLLGDINVTGDRITDSHINRAHTNNVWSIESEWAGRAVSAMAAARLRERMSSRPSCLALDGCSRSFSRCF